MNGEIWETAKMAYFKVIIRHLPAGTKENHETFQSRQKVLDGDLSRVPPEFQSAVLSMCQTSR